jgi:Tfp pilus assembly protein FimT
MVAGMQNEVGKDPVWHHRRSGTRTSLCNVTSLFNNQGMTLVGILMATAIIGLMAEGLALWLTHHMPTHRLRNAARQVMSDLVAARRHAIRWNQDISVAFLNEHMYIIWNDQDHDGTVDTREKVEAIGNLQEKHEGVRLHGSFPFHFVFNRRGMATTFLEVRITNAGGSKAITVSRSGKITLT